MATETAERTEFEILTKDTSNYWDQLRELINSQKWTTQDYATLSLLQEYDTVLSIFVVRKSDNLLIGSVILIDNPELVYVNLYIMREGFRGAGLGMKLMKLFTSLKAESIAVKPLIARSVPLMVGKYGSAPFYAEPSYDMFSCEFKDKKALLDFFPTPKSESSIRVKRIRDLTPREFRKMCEFDFHVTNQSRRQFLEDYYSIGFVEGVAMFDEHGAVKGVVGAVPTTTEGSLYKLGPIFAENKEDASMLITEIANLIKDPNAHYVLHCRTGSAGDWILEKCKESELPLHDVGKVCYTTLNGHPYVDKSKPEFIFAPMNSPVYFDG